MKRKSIANMQDPKCVFCSIVAGKIPANVIIQDESAMALLDAFPLAAGHSMVISKSHFRKIQDLESKQAAALFEMVRKVASAVEEAMQTGGTLISIHNGSEAGQEIPHVHVHIIPRNATDGAGPVQSMFKKRPKPGESELNSLSSKISARLR